jgi:hypothetical protein
MSNILTLVQDTLYSPEGALVSGSVFITNAQTMTDANGNEYPQGTTVTVSVVDGALSLELTPNIGATPDDTYYIVTYSVSDQKFREYWVVPGSPNPANLADVRTLVPPTPTPMFSIQQVIPPSGAVPGEFIEWTGDGYVTSPASGALSVNGTPVSSPNLDNTTPAAPAGQTNVTFQTDGENISASVPSASAPGGPDGSVQFNNDSVLDGLASFYVNPVNGEVTIIDTASTNSNLAALSVQGNAQGDDIQDWYITGSTIGDGADVYLDTNGNLNFASASQAIYCTQYQNLVGGATLSLDNVVTDGFSLVDDSGDISIVGGASQSGLVLASNTNIEVRGARSFLSIATVGSGFGAVGTFNLDSGGVPGIEADTSGNLVLTGNAINLTSNSGGINLESAATSSVSLALGGILYDSSNSAGTDGQLLSSTGSATLWVDAPSSPVSSVFGRTGAVTAESTDYSSFYLALSGGTLTGNLLFSADNTYTIGASGATRPSTIYAGTSVLAPLFNAATGFQIAGAAASGHYLRGNGTDYVDGTIQAADVPTLNQNTTGTAGGLSGSPSISVTNLAVSGTTSFASASIAIAALADSTIGLTDSTGLFTVTGSPASLGGALTLSAFASQAQNAFLAGPASGGAGASAFRAIQAADVPTLNQNTTGTAANVSGTPALPNGTTATTQSAGDNSTKLATTAYADESYGIAVPSSLGTFIPIFMNGATVAETVTSISAANNGQRGLYFIMPYTITVSKVAFYVGATGSGSMGVGILNATGTTKLAYADAYTPSTTGVQSVNLNASFTLQRGVGYWLVWTSTTTSLTLDVSGFTSQAYLIQNFNNNTAVVFTNSTSGGTTITMSGGVSGTQYRIPFFYFN